MTKCYFCDGELKKGEYEISHNGETHLLRGRKCTKNEDHVFFSPKAAEELRKNLHEKIEVEA